MRGRKTSTVVAQNEDTQHAILMTAMAMFAKEGVEAVPLRSINTEAGSSNTGAVHYYFRNKDGLVQAIIDFLNETVWKSAVEELKNELKAEPDIWHLLYAGLWPRRRILFDYPWGADAQTFSFELMTGASEEYRQSFRKVIQPHNDLLRTSLRKLLPALPEEIFMLRWRFLLIEATLGEWGRTKMMRVAEEPDWDLESEKLYIKRYIDYVTRGLSAPANH
jgi:AcrR family transcriptional regulator